MVGINKVDYKSWEIEKKRVSNITVSELYGILSDCVYIVEHTSGEYIEPDTVKNEDLFVLGEYWELMAQRRNEGKKRKYSDKDCVNFEFVPISNINIAFTEGRIYVKFIQYDYIGLKDTDSIKKAIKSGVVLESGMLGLRCNKVYRERVLWTYADGWLVDSIELVQRTNDGSYKRVRLALEGTIQSDGVDKDKLYRDYLSASYKTIWDVTNRERKYDKDYRSLKWSTKGLLREYDVHYDKDIDMSGYSSGVRQIGLKTNDEVCKCVLAQKVDIADNAQKWREIEEYLGVGKKLRAERIMKFELDMLGCMLDVDFREKEKGYFNETNHWYHKYELGYGLNLIIRRDWFKNYC